MGYSLGIDVGTTFTAAAVWRDDRVEVVALQSNQMTVPTVVAAAGEDIRFGDAAVARAASAPESVSREFKRRLGDPVPVFMSGAPYSADRLVGLFAKWMSDRVTAQLGEEPERTAVTHPANWTEFQRHLLATALTQAGLASVVLLTEPQAAAVDYAAAARLEPGALVLVYDLGGGTFDVALLRRDEVGLSHVGEAAGVERLGGIDFDQAVFQHVLTQVPDEVLATVRADPNGRLALAQLLTRCVETKEALSSDVAADVPVLLPGWTSVVRLTRGELDDMIRPMLRQTIDLVRQVLERNGLEPENLSAILLVGGSSRIPLVSELVGSELGVPTRVDAHPKVVVARGAARWAATAPTDVGRRALPPATTPSRSNRPQRRVVAVAAGLGVLLALGAGWVLLSRDDPGEGTTTDTSVAITTATTTGPGSTTSASAASPATSAPSVTADATGAPVSLEVPGVQDPWSGPEWTYTGIDVQSGDLLQIDATGLVKHAENSAEFGPDGDPDTSLRVFNLPGLPDVNHIALIGRIGPSGAPFLVGASYRARAEADGPLYLGFNDQGNPNDSGHLVATVAISAAEAGTG